MDDPDKKPGNTEYLPTKCRITKPPPPKPATNPLQFVKITTCPLTIKAQEQIKKVEEIKIAKKEIREEAEDWQANLDNWKSSRRKRQEHIIERVVEVKKFEQEEQDRGRRKSKTFSEMLGRHKLTIPIYDDDSNDLSDYGIGSSSSKTNSVKDVDTDDNSSLLDDKDNNVYESNKDTSSASNQSQSEDETQTNQNTRTSTTTPTATATTTTATTTSTSAIKDTKQSSFNKNLYTSNINLKNTFNSTAYQSKSQLPETKLSKFNNDVKEEPEQQYTYEGAIQNYRSRIKSKINIDESIFNKPAEYNNKSKEVNEAQNLLPKGNLFKRKEMFEGDKAADIEHLESPTSRKQLSEEFANTQSIKDRLKSLVQFSEQPLKTTDKYDVPVKSLKERLQNFNRQNDCDNNNYRPIRESVSQSNINKISNYLLDKSNSHSSLDSKSIKNEWRIKDEISDRSSSPEAELYMNKLNMFNRDLDTIMYGKSIRTIDNDLDYLRNPNYMSSASSNDIMAGSSDREDSGIHTADVSCSVSQADEQFDDNELNANTIPKCIEKLKISGDNDVINRSPDQEQEAKIDENEERAHEVQNVMEYVPKQNLEEIITATIEFLNAEIHQSAITAVVIEQKTQSPIIENKELIIENEEVIKENKETDATLKHINIVNEHPKECNFTQTAIYENVEIKPFPTEFMTNDLFGDPEISLAPPKHMLPPKEKPPPPPPETEHEKPEVPLKRLNSAKRIKKEIQIKRSSFLGLDDPIDDHLDPEAIIDKPPDIKSFLQKESCLEKTLYKKLQGSRETGLSEVESQDSGLEIERGRLSSDTWCSSLIDSSTPVHNRQDSGQTNSFTSEEEEIMKKEREIIEMVEKEEKSRDSDFHIQKSKIYPDNRYIKDDRFDNNNLGSEKFNSPYVPPRSSYLNNLDEQDSEVLKVEHELLQLEREEMERKRDSIIFRENQAKMRQQNRYSLENICDGVDYQRYTDYRKSMPELQHLNNDFRKSIPDVPSYVPPPNHYDLQYHKSMPDIQRAYNKSMGEYKNAPENSLLMIDHQKSLPELQYDNNIHRSQYRVQHPLQRQPIMPGKPIRPLKDQRDSKDRLLMMKPIDPDQSHHYNQKMRSSSGHNIHMLAAAPKPRNLDNWIQPKANPEAKSYNQHWLIQEAELRRLSDQKNTPRNRLNSNRQEKHIPEPIIQTLTQRLQNRTSLNERNQRDLRNDQSPNKEYAQHPYLGHPQTVGHALPMSYPPNVNIEETQDKMLSVSGKKKCSYCSNELGRGAAMIIESLCLFYHMECFKCCVCHMQLGDGLMGTDVRVRNQKLHCHNCYSSDDGVKFSCV